MTTRRVLGQTVTCTTLGTYSVTLNGRTYMIQRDGATWLTTVKLDADTYQTVRRVETLKASLMLLAYDHYH